MTALVLRPTAALLMFVPTLVFAWGFVGHRTLASHMHEPLPATLCLRAWVATNQSDTLQNTACDPDRWRQSDSPKYDPLEAPRHFLEIDYAKPISGYPREYADAVTRFGKYAAQNGQVPWRVEDMYSQLVAAFRTKDEANILRTMFVMSHYVTDSHSILHDTQYFDPNDGLHSRWESDMIGKTAYRLAIQTQSATLYGTPGVADPRNNIFDEVITGNGLWAQLIAADAMASGAGGVYNQTTYSLQTLFDLSKDFTARRWADALTIMASMIWTAWAEAGKPELTGFTNDCSRASPVGETVLRGFPITFTHPGDGGIVLPPYDAGTVVTPVDSGVVVVDAGQPVVVDAGSVDAGETNTGGGGGGSTGGGTGAGGGGGTEQPMGCSCTQFDAPILLFGALAFALTRRRRSAS